MKFEYSSKLKKINLILMGIGVIALVLGFFMDGSDHHNRFWSNLLVNGLFFFGISICALFFFALQYAAQAGWGVILKRIFEATMSFIPYAAIPILLVLLAGSFHGHHIFHWMAEGVMDPESSNYDEIIAGKEFFLNQPFFWIRSLLYIGVFTWFAHFFRKRSLKEDEIGGTKLHFSNFRMSALFLVIFAIFSSALTWDWIMSITTHWYSTLFGWYVFSGMWVSSITFMTLLTIYLKRKGFLPNVNKSHIHDMGKWVFALSFLWSYLWYSQFMLIWYGNKPEEATYYLARFDGYQTVFITMFLVNFILPMLILMARDTKRNMNFLVGICVVIFFSHWLDTFILIMPGTVFEHWHMGFMEIGMMLGFLGFFLHFVLRALSKANLVPRNHPFLEESIHLEH